MPDLETLPTTLLTGFLGSGKTTLLRRALVSPELSDTAVIINEIGEIAIDHHLVDFVEGNVLELPGGCLCCAVREDLARTLRSLIERREIGLGDHQHIGECGLPARFGKAVERLCTLHRVDQGDDRLSLIHI